MLEHIAVPFLVAHNMGDRQISEKYARQSYEEATNSPCRELKIFGEEEGGVEHIGVDNIEPIRSYVADWVADQFTRCERR